MNRNSIVIINDNLVKFTIREFTSNTQYSFIYDKRTNNGKLIKGNMLDNNTIGMLEPHREVEGIYTTTIMREKEEEMQKFLILVINQIPSLSNDERKGLSNFADALLFKKDFQSLAQRFLRVVWDFSPHKVYRYGFREDIELRKRYEILKNAFYIITEKGRVTSSTEIYNGYHPIQVINYWWVVYNLYTIACKWLEQKRFSSEARAAFLEATNIYSRLLIKEERKTKFAAFIKEVEYLAI